jgi:putative spermidine/putrescine transport system permease protein
VPSVLLLHLSFGGPDGYTLAHYARIVESRLYFDALVGTVQLGLVVTVVCLLAGYPVAYLIARSGPRFTALAMGIVLLPLFVSVVVRSFGWMVLFGRQGTINRTLIGLGLIDRPMQLLYTPGAVVVGLVHILLPLMVLPIASVLRGVDPAAREAASSLGASPARVFWTVTFPLSLPGVAVGCVLVLAHAIAAFVLPALIGSDSVRLMATMIFQQVMVANNVALGAALAVVLVAATFLILAAAQLAARRLTP